MYGTEDLKKELAEERLAKVESEVAALKELVTGLRIQVAYLTDDVEELSK